MKTRKKYGFKDFISKSLPLKASLPSYIPLTRRTFTDMSQIKKGMKLVYYEKTYGCTAYRRTKRPYVVIVTKDYIPITDIYVQGKTKYNQLVLLQEKEIFFYEEEKALGRVE